MKEPLSPILLGFPETESFNELRFHLKELHWDLTSLVKKVKVLSAVIPDTPQSLLSIRNGLVDVVCGIEHGVSHHLAEALKLVGQVLTNSSVVEVGERLASLEVDWDGEELPQSEDATEDVNSDDSIRLHLGLEALTSALSVALEGVDQAIAIQGGEPRRAEQLQYELEQLVEVLGRRAWLQSQQLYKQALRLYQTADPVKAAQEDYWQLLATPLQEEYHPSARSLNYCLRCGAILTSDDRTFDGSYCEFCRTRWIESSKKPL